MGFTRVIALLIHGDGAHLVWSSNTLSRKSEKYALGSVPVGIRLQSPTQDRDGFERPAWERSVRRASSSSASRTKRGACSTTNAALSIWSLRPFIKERENASIDFPAFRCNIFQCCMTWFRKERDAQKLSQTENSSKCHDEISSHLTQPSTITRR